MKAEIDRLDAEDDRQNHRIDVLEQGNKDMRDLMIAVHELAINMQRMLNEQEKQGARLDKIESEPANKWKRMGDKAIDTVIGVLIGALVAGLAAMIAQYIK